MNLPKFLRSSRDGEHRRITKAARAMRKAGVNADKAKVRANVDEMRRKAGLPPAEWPTLKQKGSKP